MKQKILALFPPIWLPTEGSEVKHTRSASPPPRFLTRWPGTDRQAGPGKTARSARDFGESRAHRAHSGGKNSEKNSKKFFERF